jgi:hypothetical protein
VKRAQRASPRPQFTAASALLPGCRHAAASHTRRAAPDSPLPGHRTAPLASRGVRPLSRPIPAVTRPTSTTALQRLAPPARWRQVHVSPHRNMPCIRPAPPVGGRGDAEGGPDSAYDPDAGADTSRRPAPVCTLRFLTFTQLHRTTFRLRPHLSCALLHPAHLKYFNVHDYGLPTCTLRLEPTPWITHPSQCGAEVQCARCHPLRRLRSRLFAGCCVALGFQAVD